MFAHGIKTLNQSVCLPASKLWKEVNIPVPTLTVGVTLWALCLCITISERYPIWHNATGIRYISAERLATGYTILDN